MDKGRAARNVGSIELLFSEVCDDSTSAGVVLLAAIEREPEPVAVVIVVGVSMFVGILLEVPCCGVEVVTGAVLAL